MPLTGMDETSAAMFSEGEESRAIGVGDDAARGEDRFAECADVEERPG